MSEEMYPQELIDEYYNAIQELHESLDDKDQQITDLQSQLDEKDKEIETLKAKLETSEYWNKKYDDCQQQLEEKEKEIEKLKIILNMQAVQASEEQRLSIINTNCIQYNPNRIAIEQLIQAKKYIKNSLEDMWNTNAEMTCRDRNIIDGIYNKIDDQITNLKGNKDE